MTLLNIKRLMSDSFGHFTKACGSEGKSVFGLFQKNREHSLNNKVRKLVARIAAIKDDAGNFIEVCFLREREAIGASYPLRANLPYFDKIAFLHHAIIAPVTRAYNATFATEEAA